MAWKVEKKDERPAGSSKILFSFPVSVNGGAIKELPLRSQSKVNAHCLKPSPLEFAFSAWVPGCLDE
jgi:hypothetical protein